MDPFLVPDDVLDTKKSTDVTYANNFIIGDTLYTLKQLTSIAQTLRKWEDIGKLVNFFNQVPFEAVKQCDQLLYTIVYARFHEANYERVIALLLDSSLGRFEESYHRELQAIWEECHYKLFEKDKGKYPQEVQRFRIRKRHTYPSSIWNGDKFKYSFTVKDREVMEKYFKKNPKPNRKLKEELAEKTHLTVQQVTTWFKNKRNRHTKNVDDDDSTDEDINPCGSRRTNTTSIKVQKKNHKQRRRAK